MEKIISVLFQEGAEVVLPEVEKLDVGVATNWLLKVAGVWAPKVAGAVAIFVVFLIAAKIVKRLITNSAERLNLDGNLTALFARSGTIALIALGMVTAMGTLGVDVSALVAGLGLTGFALGFAMKDTISNLLSGVLILLYRPFEVGHRVKIAGYEGTVVSIDLRYTELKFEDLKILIPNSKLFTDPITVLK